MYISYVNQIMTAPLVSQTYCRFLRFGMKSQLCTAHDFCSLLLRIVSRPSKNGPSCLHRHSVVGPWNRNPQGPITTTRQNVRVSWSPNSHQLSNLSIENTTVWILQIRLLQCVTKQQSSVCTDVCCQISGWLRTSLRPMLVQKVQRRDCTHMTQESLHAPGKQLTKQLTNK